MTKILFYFDCINYVTIARKLYVIYVIQTNIYCHLLFYTSITYTRILSIVIYISTAVL